MIQQGAHQVATDESGAPGHGNMLAAVLHEAILRPHRTNPRYFRVVLRLRRSVEERGTAG